MSRVLGRVLVGGPRLTLAELGVFRTFAALVSTIHLIFLHYRLLLSPHSKSFFQELIYLQLNTLISLDLNFLPNDLIEKNVKASVNFLII